EEDDLFPGLCPQCGRVTFLTYDLREPLGYRDPYWAPDYDGTTLWSPQAGYARPTFPETLTDLPPLGNLSARGGKVELVSTNTGQDGAGFTFQAHSRTHGLLVPDAVELAHAFPRSPRPPDPIPDSEAIRGVALGRRKVTDALLLRPLHLPAGLTVNPISDAIRGAWLSFAYLARDAAWRVLDAAPDELVAGFHPMLSDHGPGGEAYLTDTLVNGAGYARYFLASSKRLAELQDAMA